MVGILTTTPLLPSTAATPSPTAASPSPIQPRKSGPSTAQTGALTARAAAAAPTGTTELGNNFQIVAETNDFIVAVYAPDGKADRVVVFPKDGNPVYVANNLTDPMQQGKEGLSVTVTTTKDRKEGVDIKIELDKKNPHKTAKVMVKTWKLTESKLMESQPKQATLTLKGTQVPLWFGSDTNSQNVDKKIDRTYGPMDVTVDATLTYPIVIVGNNRDEDHVVVKSIDGRPVNKNLVVMFEETKLSFSGKPELNTISIQAPIDSVQLRPKSLGTTVLVSEARNNYVTMPEGATLETKAKATPMK